MTIPIFIGAAILIVGLVVAYAVADDIDRLK